MKCAIVLVFCNIFWGYSYSQDTTLAGYSERPLKDVDGTSEICNFILTKKKNYENTYFYYKFEKCNFINSNKEPIRSYPYNKTDTLLFFPADSTLYIYHQYLKPVKSQKIDTHIEYLYSTEGVTDSACKIFFHPVTGIASFTSIHHDQVFLTYELRP